MLNECETLMLDMDGTVLDLAYDNYVWKELVPEHYAEAKGLSIDVARKICWTMSLLRAGIWKTGDVPPHCATQLSGCVMLAGPNR